MSELLAAAVVFGFSLGFSQELAKDLRRWFRRYRRAHSMGPPKGSYGPAHVDWRRSFSHENFNPPGGPPPLKLRRSEPDPPEQFIRMDDGRTQRGNGHGGPTTPKPEIIPQVQGLGPVRHISVGYQPRPSHGTPNPPPEAP